MQAALAFLLLLLAAPAWAAAGAPRVFQDDWPLALDEARAKDLPIFVDAWAPW